VYVKPHFKRQKDGAADAEAISGTASAADCVCQTLGMSPLIH
jgi:hypothetical protein